MLKIGKYCQLFISKNNSGASPQMLNMIVRDDQGLKFTLPTVRAIVAWELSNSLSLLSTHDN